jgi:hypothetical protein
LAQYRFVTTWLLGSDRDPVWDAIYDQRAWPTWWHGLERVVEIDPGDDNGIGAHSELTWRARVPYRLVMEIKAHTIEPPHLVEASVKGDLSGSGRWRLFDEGAVTAVVFEWDVRTTRAWMNALAPIARPIFRANHDWVMRNGATGIAGLLGVPLLAAE